MRIMEEPEKGWDLARQDLLAQYLKNAVTFFSVGIFFREASMSYPVFTADPLKKEINICELAGSIMCPPDNTARGKTLLRFFPA